MYLCVCVCACVSCGSMIYSCTIMQWCHRLFVPHPADDRQTRSQTQLYCVAHSVFAPRSLRILPSRDDYKLFLVFCVAGTRWLGRCSDSQEAEGAVLHRDVPSYGCCECSGHAYIVASVPGLPCLRARKIVWKNGEGLG